MKAQKVMALWPEPGAGMASPVPGLTRRRALGGAALLDVGARLAPDVLARLSESLLLPAAVSILYREVPFALLGEAAAAVLYVGVFYAVAPLVYRAGDDAPEDRRLNVLIAALAGGFAVVLGLLRTVRPVPVVGLFAGGFLLAQALFVAYFGIDGVLDPDGVPAAVADRFFPSDVPADLRERRGRAGLAGVRARTAARFAVTGVLAVGCVVIGLLGTVMSQAYPLPEVLVLGWAAYGPLARRWGRLPVGARPSLSAVDVEQRVYRSARQVTRGLKGFLTVVVAAAGLLVSTVVLWIGAAVAVPLAAAARGADPLFAWDLLGLLAALAAAGAYGTWFWVRVFDRVPAYLDCHESGATDRSVPTRPVGLLVPSTVALASIVPLLAWPDATAARVAFGVAWPAAVGLVAAATLLTRRLAPQSPTTEQWALPAAAVVEALGLWTVANHRTLLGLRPGGTGPLVELGFVVAGLLVAFYSAEIRDLAARIPPLQGRRDDVWLVLLGLLLLGFAAAFRRPGLEGVLSAAAAVALLAVLLPAAWRAIARRRTDRQAGTGTDAADGTPADGNGDAPAADE